MKSLLAGTCAATALFAAAANAQSLPQSDVQNEQTLNGDIFADQQLHVIDPSEGVVATGAASGNALSAGADGGNLNVSSEQFVDAEVRGRTDVEIHGWTPTTIAVTSAAGNTGEAWSSGGVVTAESRQVIGENGAVRTSTDVRAELSSSGDTAAASTSIGNHQGYAVDQGGYVSAGNVQTQQGVVRADTSASQFHVKGAATVTSAAVSNSVDHAGTGASAELYAGQRTSGQTIAESTTQVTSGAQVDGNATATANNVSAISQSIDLSVVAEQSNAGYVRAENYVYVQDFGAISSTAAGVGNSVMAGNQGENLDLYTDQQNDGFIDVEAGLEAGFGYDATVAATAFGNAVTGYVCTDCDGRLDATNRQVNNAGVSASTNATIDGNGRFVSSTASAVGNNATYYVAKPGG